MLVLLTGARLALTHTYCTTCWLAARRSFKWTPKGRDKHLFSCQRRSRFCLLGAVSVTPSGQVTNIFFSLFFPLLKNIYYKYLYSEIIYSETLTCHPQKEKRTSSFILVLATYRTSSPAPLRSSPALRYGVSVSESPPTSSSPSQVQQATRFFFSSSAPFESFSIALTHHPAGYSSKFRASPIPQIKTSSLLFAEPRKLCSQNITFTLLQFASLPQQWLPPLSQLKMST